MNESRQHQQQRQEVEEGEEVQQPVTGFVTSGAQTAHANPFYQTAGMVVSGAPQVAIPSQQQLAFQQAQHMHLQLHQHQQQLLQAFWAARSQEIHQTTDFKNHSLPLARIKKIMKADEDVRMISAEAPVVFAKACEIFILELTLRSWIHTEENKRRTLQKTDIAAAITRTDIFDFLVDIVPRDDLREEGFGFPRISLPVPTIGAPPDAIPYYYMPQMGASPGAMYPRHQPPVPYNMPWLQSHPQTQFQPPQQQPQQTQQQQQPEGPQTHAED